MSSEGDRADEAPAVDPLCGRGAGLFVGIIIGIWLSIIFCHWIAVLWFMLKVDEYEIHRNMKASNGNQTQAALHLRR